MGLYLNNMIFFCIEKKGIMHQTIPMNFPFFMLMVGPSQTGKTNWILNFIKYFSFINPGHALQNVLFLHMAEFKNLSDLDHESYRKINFHSVKSTMADNESQVDEEIISTIEKFKGRT